MGRRKTVSPPDATPPARLNPHLFEADGITPTPEFQKQLNEAPVKDMTGGVQPGEIVEVGMPVLMEIGYQMGMESLSQAGWEYKHVWLIDALLELDGNKLGADGWELVSAHRDREYVRGSTGEGSYLVGYRCIFKRPKQCLQVEVPTS